MDTPAGNSPRETKWFYVDENRNPIGPVPFDTLQELAKANQIHPYTHVIEESGTAWKPFSSISGTEPGCPCPATKLKRWPIVLLLIFGWIIWPWGLHMLWRSSAFSKTAKWIIMLPVLFIGGCLFWQSLADAFKNGAFATVSGGLMIVVMIAFSIALWKSGISIQSKRSGIASVVASCIFLLATDSRSNVTPDCLSSTVPPISSSAYSGLPKYEIIRTNDSSSSSKVVYDVRINYNNGRFPNREQIAKIADAIRQKAAKYERVFICFWLPDMFLDAGAFATAQYTPTLNIAYEPSEIAITLLGNWLAGFREKYGRSFGDDPGVNKLYDEYSAKLAKSRDSEQERLSREFYEKLRREIEKNKGTAAKAGAGERGEQDLNECFLDDDELAQKREKERVRQSRRYWENPNDNSILRNLDRKDRDFWGSTPGHR